MKRARVIPVLLLAREGLVKTVCFSQPRYLGDPINAVKILNEKMIDELVLLDIEASTKDQIAYDQIEDIVSEAFMPVAYGGGLSSVEQCAELFKRGVEKIIINTSAYENPQLITNAAQRFGSQSVVVSIDGKHNFWRRHKAYIKGGKKETEFSPVELAVRSQDLGAGEIFLTSIEKEGTFSGYDLGLLRSVSSALRIPVIANGGAGNIEHFRQGVVEGGCSAVAAGSMFVFAAKGEGVLINYPSQSQLENEFWAYLA